MKSIVLAGLFAIGFGLATIPAASAAPGSSIGGAAGAASLVEQTAYACRRIRVCRWTPYGRRCWRERVCRHYW